MINDVMKLPVFLEGDRIKLLQTCDYGEVMLFCGQEQEPGRTAQYFPANTIRVAAQAIAEEYVRQGGENRTLRAVIGQLQMLGVHFDVSPNP